MSEFGRILAAGIAAYLASETNSPAGKLNLALCVLLGVLAVATCVPSVVVIAIRAFFKVQFPDWVYAIPLMAFIIVVFAAMMSYVMIPKQPLDWDRRQ